MSSTEPQKVWRCAALSVVKHAYLPNAVAAHPRFDLVVVADDPSQPQWVHERNQIYADQHNIPYIRYVDQAILDYNLGVAVVSSEAERHCWLSTKAANAGLHIIQDKPMSTRLSDCDQLLKLVKEKQVKFLLWNRNCLPAVLHAQEVMASGSIGDLRAIHIDFYFAKDAGPPKGTRNPGYPHMDWQSQLIQAHSDGSDGGVGTEAMGELQVEGIYPLGYLRALTGAKVVRVMAQATSHFHQVHADNHVDDLATVSLEMDNGVVGTLAMGRIGAASHPEIGEIKIHIIGSKSSAVLSEARPEVGIYYRGQSVTEFRNRRVANENDRLLMDHFATAIETDGPTALDAQAGRDICAVVEAAIQSSQTGKVVEVL